MLSRGFSVLSLLLLLCSTSQCASASKMAEGQTTFAKATMEPSATVEHAIVMMLKMFQSSSVEEQSSIIREQYTADAIFIDPIMKVHGHRDISLEFYSLIKMFTTTIERKETSVTGTDTPSVVKASIENHQTYELKRESWLAKKTLPEKVELDVTTVLLVNESSGKILSHEEIWRNKRVPVPRFMKPFVGSSTALFMRLLGWGKDVAPPAHPKST